MARIQAAPSGDKVERKTTPGEELVCLNNATLHSFKLMATGLGFDVHLTIPLEEKDKLSSLTEALQRVVDIHVVRVSRKARRAAAAENA